MIKIDFSFETEHGIFRDCIVLPEDHNLSISEIEDMKQKRLDAWLSAIAPEGEE